MKLSYTLIAAALLSTTALAGTPALETPADDFKRLSGSMTMGYATNYTGRGYVVSHSVAQGDDMGFAALKYSYDFGRKGKWSAEGAIMYAAPFSGHTLYGNPTFGPNAGVAVYCAKNGISMNSLSAEQKAYISQQMQQKHIKQGNIENEFVVQTGLKYTTEKWNIGFGHDFVHGGLLGVMAKHFRGNGASTVNEIYITPEWTPAKWVSLSVATRYSIQGVHGWWFEPQVTFKAPIIGTPEDIKVAGVLQFGMSATCDYFTDRYNACSNGSQAFWIKFSTPWFVNDKFVVTPSVSFNWLGKGGMKANKQSEFKHYTENSSYVPFRNFGVVGGLMATYMF